MALLDYVRERFPVLFRKHRTARTAAGGKPIAGYVSGAALAELRVDEPRDLADLADKMRQDYMVRFSELILKSNLTSAPVTITVETESGSGDGRAAALAEQLQRLWGETLPSMCQSIGDGRVAYEKVWRYDAGRNLNVIERLEPLPFRQTALQLDEDGDFAGLELRVGEDAVKLPPQKCWWLALDPTVLEPHGRSRYVGAPCETWKQRQETFRLRKLYLKRFALRGGVAHIPPTVKNEQTGLVEDNFAKMAAAYESYYAGGLIMFPNSRDTHGRFLNEWTEQPSAMDPTPLETVLDGQDTEQLRAFGIPEKTVIEGAQVGSHAMVTVQMLTLLSVVEDLLNQFTGSFRKQVIDNVIALNYRGTEAPQITITYPPLKERLQENAAKCSRVSPKPD